MNGKNTVARRGTFVVLIDAERCKGCELCISACPRGVLKMDTAINAKGYHFARFADPDRCTGCALCALMCPDAAVEVAEDEP